MQPPASPGLYNFNFTPYSALMTAASLTIGYSSFSALKDLYIENATSSYQATPNKIEKHFLVYEPDNQLRNSYWYLFTEDVQSCLLYPTCCRLPQYTQCPSNIPPIQPWMPQRSAQLSKNTDACMKSLCIVQEVKHWLKEDSIITESRSKSACHNL